MESIGFECDAEGVEEKYELVSFINYTPGHYTAFYRRILAESWWKFDGAANTITKIDNNDIKVQRQILMLVKRPRVY